MGQRLNIEIKDRDTVLATGYYHWSAYTIDSVTFTDRIISDIDKIDKTKPLVYQAVQLLYNTGARLSEKEEAYIKGNPKLDCLKPFITGEQANRNDGLIDVSPEGIAETEQWEEGRVEIYLTERKVVFGVIDYWDIDEYITENMDDGTTEEEFMNTAYVLPFDDIPETFDEWYSFSSIIRNIYHSGTDYVITKSKDSVLAFV